MRQDRLSMGIVKQCHRELPKKTLEDIEKLPQVNRGDHDLIESVLDDSGTKIYGLALFDKKTKCIVSNMYPITPGNPSVRKRYRKVIKEGNVVEEIYEREIPRPVMIKFVDLQLMSTIIFARDP
jgi:hypothetical protein